ncbi:MAG: contractile injection system protein, VgrG/Pvc8 family [Bacteroidota bacterium]
MTQVKSTISIKAKSDWAKDKFAIRSLSLHQPFNGHHVFEVVTAVEKDMKLDSTTLASLLGENVVISIESLKQKDDSKNSEKWFEFHGFIDQINATWTKSGRVLRVKGYSKSILMDAAPVFRTFSEKNVGDVARKVVSDYGGKIPKVIEKELGDRVNFMVQSQETDYRFLCRLADDYNLLFFFDGQEFYFGDLNNIEKNKVTLQLEGQGNCQHADLSLNLAPLEFKMQGYDLLQDKLLEKIDNNINYRGENEVLNTTISRSSIYPSANIHVNYAVENEQPLKRADKKITARQAHELVVLTGTSNEPSLKIGSKVKMKSSDELLSAGEYLVIEVHHHISSDDSYQNNFTAVPLGFPFALRMQQGSNAMCGPLSAIIEDHKDPEELGRVKVKFVGDKEKDSISPWLRVLVPFTTNSGFYFLPEKGEKVIVFFEDFNPEKSPFVLGSFYHKNAKASRWKESNNRKKGIQMEKISFVFDDKTGKLTIEAEEIEVIAKKNMNLDGGNSLKQKATRIDLN